MYSDPERDVYTFLISAQKKREAPISSLYDVVCDIFLAESRYASQSSRLSQIISSGRGIQPLINEAARILEAYICGTWFHLNCSADSISVKVSDLHTVFL